MPGYILPLSDKLPTQYLCSYCKFLVRDAKQTPCGHVYCESCIDDLVGLGTKLICLEDGKIIDESQIFQDNFVRREVLSLVVMCPNTDRGCKWTGEVRQMEEHHTNECSIQYPASCPKCNKGGIAQELMSVQWDPVCGDCTEVGGTCPFSTVGCPVKEVMDKDRRSKHMVEKTTFHLSLVQKAYEKILKTRTQVLETVAIRDNIALADLGESVRELKLITYDGILVWKITDVARRRSEAVTGHVTSFDSQQFYSSRQGYRMCARIYLNGFGIGRGNSVSLFFVIMRGEYDALVRWPFRQQVTLMLLDQDNVEHIIDAFHPDPLSSSFHRPREEINIASGCPTFCPLTELDKHAYIRDDTMFIKIIV